MPVWHKSVAEMSNQAPAQAEEAVCRLLLESHAEQLYPVLHKVLFAHVEPGMGLPFEPSPPAASTSLRSSWKKLCKLGPHAPPFSIANGQNPS